MSLTLHPPAKVNLYLRVGSRRPDGFHEIDSLFQMIDLCDTLTLTPTESGVDLKTSGRPLSGDPSENLVFRAARLFQAETGIPRGVRIFLEKVIPAGAGLGGGSSDAAATLIGLDRLWEARCPRPRLHALAARLGSDVPFFLDGPTAHVRGRGERVDSLPGVFPYHLVVVFPGVAIGTAWAYRGLDALRGDPLTNPPPYPMINRFPDTIQEGNPEAWYRQPNDLEPIAVAAYPEVAAALRALSDRGGEWVRMSGSGSAVFGLFSDPVGAKEAEQALAADWGADNVWCCRPLTRPPYARHVSE